MRLKTTRVGRFHVADYFFEKLDVGEGTNLFDSMIVLAAERDIGWQRVAYTAIHPAFDEVREGQIIPEYDALFFDRNGLPEWRRKP